MLIAVGLVPLISTEGAEEHISYCLYAVLLDGIVNSDRQIGYAHYSNIIHF